MESMVRVKGRRPVLRKKKLLYIYSVRYSVKTAGH